MSMPRTHTYVHVIVQSRKCCQQNDSITTESLSANWKLIYYHISKLKMINLLSVNLNGTMKTLKFILRCHMPVLQAWNMHWILVGLSWDEKAYQLTAGESEWVHYDTVIFVHSQEVQCLWSAIAQLYYWAGSVFGIVIMCIPGKHMCISY